MLKSKKWRPIALTVFLIVLLSAAAFLYFLLKVDILPQEYLIILVASIVLLVTIIGVLLFYRMRKKRSKARRVRRIIAVVLSVVFSCVCLYGAAVMFRLNETKNAVIVNPNDTPRAVVGVYVMADDPASSLANLSDYRFAVLGELGVEKLHSNYALGVINEKTGSSVGVLSFAGVTEAADALLDGSVQAIAVSKNFIDLLEDTEDYSGFPAMIRLIDEIVVPQSATLENTPDLIGSSSAAPESTPEPTPKPTPEPTPEPIKYGEDRPLVFYLSGIDGNTHADVNILMAINPITKQVLVVSTPRDTFVTNFALGGGDKLTHCAYQGISNSIAALEDLYDTHVDNFCRISFTGFTELVDLIGGITIYNPTAFRSDPDNCDHYFEEGTLNLNGYLALCYVRERHAFGDGDLARGRNQVRVITAMLNAVKENGATVLLRYSEILDILADTFETDLTSAQISDLVKVAMGSLSEWDIRSYSTWGGSGIRTVASMGSQQVAIIWPNSNSVAFATKLLGMITNGETITDEIMATAP